MLFSRYTAQIASRIAMQAIEPLLFIKILLLIQQVPGDTDAEEIVISGLA